MAVKLNRELKPIKAGWSSHAAALGLTAHGVSKEVADRNLERTVQRFLSPFQRDGTLQQEIMALSLEIEGDEDELEVILQ